MEFLSTTANECTSEGQANPQQKRVEVQINADLIAAKIERNYLLKQGKVIKLGDKYYTDFQQPERKPVKVVR